MTEKAKKRPVASGLEVPPLSLPPGVTLVRTLRGHTDWIGRIAWSPDGRLLASPSRDQTIRIWDAETGECLRKLEGHAAGAICVAFNAGGHILASGSYDNTAKLWDVASGKVLHTLEGHSAGVASIAFDPKGRTLASGGEDGIIRLWNVTIGSPIKKIRAGGIWVPGLSVQPHGTAFASAHLNGEIKLWNWNGHQLRSLLSVHLKEALSVAFDARGLMLASAGGDGTINLWEADRGSLLRSLEGHHDKIQCVSFSADGRLLASKGSDHTIRIWSSATGVCLGSFSEPSSVFWPPGLAFHPLLPLLATVGSDPAAPRDPRDERGYYKLGDRLIHIWELDPSLLLAQDSASAVTYTSAKIVLVGDSGVGKTGLGWRIAHGEFKEHASTHGQQFWPLQQLDFARTDGTQCEAVLWDLAGQPDYRLIHALFLDDADLALVLFDPTRNDDPLQGVEFWLKHLKVDAPTAGSPTAPGAGTPTLLVAARCDRGDARLTREELAAYCLSRGIRAYHVTSAAKGEGISELIKRMKSLIPWDDKPATVTTETFKRIKDYVLSLKESRRRRKLILAPQELRQSLQKSDRKWRFADAEMLTAVGHLGTHGYVTRLKTSKGEVRILLAPELLNNLAASFVLEARRNPKGLGSLEEQRLLSGSYNFPELKNLSEADREILVDSAASLFLEHNVCFRETDPLSAQSYLVFPELINLKKPPTEEVVPVEDGVAYTVSGAIENVYSSLVVLLGYTHTFTRTNQWRNQARYEVGNGLVCGFRQEEEREGELDFVLYFGVDVGRPIRMLFQSLFESFLARRNLTVHRFEPVNCPKGHAVDRTVVRKRRRDGFDFTFCHECGNRVILPKTDAPIQLTRQQAVDLEVQRQAADQRSRFEQVLFRLKSHVGEQNVAVPSCFISYAWGEHETEHWVEHSLAKDLLKAGITVLLDRWENSRIGASVPRFVERLATTDRVLVVGTPLYRTKYDNKTPMGGFVVAAEGDLIGGRMLGTEGEKECVLPLLLAGSKETSFPALLQTRVYADFRQDERYFATAFELILSIYQIEPQDAVAVALRGALHYPRLDGSTA